MSDTAKGNWQDHSGEAICQDLESEARLLG